MELFVDSTDGRALTTQLYDQLRHAIIDGQLSAGDRLVPSRTLAADLDVSRSTVTEVYGRLAAEGYIEGRAGGGSVVASIGPAPASPPPGPGALAPTPRAARVAMYDRQPTQPARLDLRAGRVDPALFPHAAWRRCTLAGLDRASGQYGDPAGTAELREALVRWVTRSRGVTATGDQVVVTSGTGHAVDLVARVLLEPGDLVAVEEPGYPPVVELLRGHGLRVAGVPVDEHGLIVDALPPGARLVYVTPSHQYPLGMMLAWHRRRELLRWASRNNAAVVEDDYDTEFRHVPRPVEPLQRLDRDGRVIYVGTFSKILSPALRLGFLVAPESLLPAIRAARQAVDWCPPGVTQQAMAAFIESGHLDRHLRRCRAVYRDRYQRMWDMLGELLPPGYRRLPAYAGLHIAVVGPEDERVYAAPEVLVSSLRRTYHFGDPVAGLLVGFGALPTNRLAEGCRALVAALGDRAAPG